MRATLSSLHPHILSGLQTLQQQHPQKWQKNAGAIQNFFPVYPLLCADWDMAMNGSRKSQLMQLLLFPGKDRDCLHCQSLN